MREVHPLAFVAQSIDKKPGMGVVRPHWERLFHWQTVRSKGMLDFFFVVVVRFRF